jgi:hypothetical protein
LIWVKRFKEFLCINSYFVVDLEQYQADIIRNLRRVNSDYLQVGFYDSSFNRSLAQSMVPYQLSGVEESIALIYG